MKGVSEIIAIILILMIVIALAALAYTWFSGIFSSLTATAGTSVTQSTNAMATQFNVENAKNFTIAGGNSNVSVTIRNVGSQNIDMTKLAAYIGGTLSTISAGNIGTLPPGAPSTIYVTYTSAAGLCGSTMTVSIGTGLSSSKTISC